MTKETLTKTKVSPVFISSDDSNLRWLLFVDQKPPSKHDLLVTDFVGTFSSPENAMKWYDGQHLPYGEPQALIARFDGCNIVPKYRSIVLGEEDHLHGHPAWTYAYDDPE